MPAHGRFVGAIVAITTAAALLPCPIALSVASRLPRLSPSMSSTMLNGSHASPSGSNRPCGLEPR
jgi:hypothetical protein